MKTVILMTASINPNGMSNTAVQNIEIRKSQYVEAVSYYLSTTVFPIVFVENTGYDISCLYEKEIQAERLEVIVYKGNDFDRNRGKGYGEGLIIRNAFEKSKLLCEKCTVIKISGRHIVKNTKSIWRILNRLHISHHFVACDINPKVKKANSDMFVASTDFFYFLTIRGGYAERINEEHGVWFEHILYDSIIDYCKHQGEFIYLPLPLNQVGVSGSTGAQFTKPSKRLYLKHIIKFVLYKMKIIKL